VLWKSYKHVSNLRAATRSTPDVKPEEFAVLVRDVPKPPPDETIKDSVDSYFRALHPDTFYRSMVVTDHRKVLPLFHVSPLCSVCCLLVTREKKTLCIKHIQTERGRKRALFCSDQIHITLQADKIYQEIEDHKRKIARAEAVYAASKTAGKPEGTRPTHKTGFLGLVGTKVDTIEYCNEKIKELVPELEAEQKATLREKQQPAAIVFFNSRAAAASASQALHAQVFDKWTVMEAPGPRDIIWPNLPRKIYERQIRQVVVYFIVFLIVFFYTIPLTAIAAFTTLDELRAKLPFLKVIVDQKEVKTILEAYLPQLALIVFLALLPSLLLFLSKSEGIPTHSHAVRAASGKYFYFIVFNVFIGYTIGSTLFKSLTTILNNPRAIVSMLARSLPGSATFFLTFVALK
jgi:calcium permeable stress-gated cation channel